ncbi:hypothetical protein [Paraburkholderia sp. BL23I1N1]|uniref:hypothetical protein n=1 Tax=Paraburkholderia sp. BL23I1N1 TaxID=1938802 RepID=UPI0016012391|nr:hypothetical protein [Paraburkholderia sp. BL23I1N1]
MTDQRKLREVNGAAGSAIPRMRMHAATCESIVNMAAAAHAKAAMLPQAEKAG